MSHRRREHESGMAEAREALASANRDLYAVRARWPAIRAISRHATTVATEARNERIRNHLGDLFADALGDG